jgi:sialidase-1
LNYDEIILSILKMRPVYIFVLAIILLPGCSNKHNIDPTWFDETQILLNKVPLEKGILNENIIEIKAVIADTGEYIRLQSLEIILTEGSNTEFIESVEIVCGLNVDEDQKPDFFGSVTDNTNGRLIAEGNTMLVPGNCNISAGFKIKDNGLLHQSFKVEAVELKFDQNRSLILEPASDFVYRPAIKLRSAGQDEVDTYRIPGLITTNEGTLIAVYDNRYNNSKDLQEDIDIGMSRSIDGGQNWEPMRVIMDMGEWGGRSESLNGTGDPSILYDPATSTIWVAALWMSGVTEKDMLWWASQPGLNPSETGQLLLAKSEDDGLTWSDPVNITEQIKDPSWQLLLQGPGKGICMSDGTLVFPVQYKADIGENAIDGGQYTCHSTIIYSSDHGQTWQIGNGAKSNTTEAQVVELDNGTLMLNMRDDRNRSVKDDQNGRAVAVITDMGQSWTVHSSSNSALPEPNCMASIISCNLDSDYYSGRVLLFSNPNNKYSRTNMTIKASVDDGTTWPLQYHTELNEQAGYGYSCLTIVDDTKIGIVYEGVKELYFQLIQINEILGNVY